MSFTEEELAAIDAALSQLEEAFAKLVSLDAKTRQRLFKMGSGSKGFCRDALNILDQNRQLALPALGLNKALQALTTIDQLRPRVDRVLALSERLQDTQLALGAEVATTARRVYKNLKEYAHEHGLEGMRNRLSTRFKKRPRAKPASAGGEDQAA